jgi:predicted amidohydrolase YtcJ
MGNNSFTHVDSKALAPSLIIINACVHTMNINVPTATSVAVYGNRIMAIGSTAEIHRMSGPDTHIIDACGRIVMPGFNDSHVHFLRGGFQLSSVNLRDANSPQEFVERICRFAEKRHNGQWITGGDWDHERWPDTRLPTKELIDPFTANTPIFVNRLDGHMALANSLALKLAGVTRDTKDIPGGFIMRDTKTGEPTGILKDAAQSLVWKVIPDSDFEEKIVAARAATTHAARFGVTSVQDMSGGNDVGVYQKLLCRGELLTRIYAISSLPDWQPSERLGVHSHCDSEMLRVGGLKGFADGSLGASTAFFFEPYEDEPNTYGLAGNEMYPKDAMLERVIAADRHGIQVIVHAIGDKANDEILSIYEQTIEENAERDRRFRIEHAQHLRPQDIPRFGKAHIIASMQPYHVIDDGCWTEKRIGKRRAHTAYAFRSLLASGATLAFGTDWNIAPLNPMLGIYAAVTRRTLDGKHPHGWIPEQKITVEEAVRAYTVGSAYAEFTDNIKGTISPGKLADIIILSRNIFEIDPDEIKKTEVSMTIVDGNIIYEQGSI